MQILKPSDFLQKNFLLPQTELAPADLGFIFGNKFVCRELAHEAARLYHLDYFRKILVSGGVEAFDGVCEAHAISRALTHLGVSGSDIIIECGANNTGENVSMSLPLLDQEIGLENINSVIGFGHFSAGPRFLMTLKRHWPDVHAMHKSVFPPGMNIDNWREDEAMAIQVLWQYQKLGPYLQAGFLEPVDLPALNAKTRDMRRMASPTATPDLKFG